MGLKKAVWRQPQAAMTRPIIELIASCAVVRWVIHRCSVTRSLVVLTPVFVLCVAPIVAYMIFVLVAIIAGF